MTSDLLTLTHATERDIDLLLVEELKCSLAFVDWLAQQIGRAMSSTITVEASEVLHSRRRVHSRREIDITVLIRTGSALPVMLLIENKLDTAEQTAQAESYRDEARFLVQSGAATAAYILLTCPAQYAQDNRLFASKFDAVITYEMISAFLEDRVNASAQELSARLRHRHELVEQAIHKHRRGYEAVPVAAVEEFNSSYVALCRDRFPQLKPGPTMLKRGRPSESKTMIFAPETLPDWPFLPQMRIVHQLREGNVNVNFYGWGDWFTSVAAQIATDLSGTPYRPIPTINKRPGGRSGLMLVTNTPPVDNVTTLFEVQREAILTGMEAAERLRAWVWSKRSVIEQWTALIERQRAASGGHYTKVIRLSGMWEHCGNVCSTIPL